LPSFPWQSKHSGGSTLPNKQHQSAINPINYFRTRNWGSSTAGLKGGKRRFLHTTSQRAPQPRDETLAAAPGGSRRGCGRVFARRRWCGRGRWSGG
jgi:hypothetical protein